MQLMLFTWAWVEHLLRRQAWHCVPEGVCGRLLELSLGQHIRRRKLPVTGQSLQC